MPQASTTGLDRRSSFRLSGGAPIGAAPPVGALLQAQPPSPALNFHDRLRLMEERGVYPVPAGASAPSGAAAPSVQSAGPGDTVGNPRMFKVLANLTNSTFFTNVYATAKSVGAHIILYLDDQAPADGLTQPDYDKLVADFDTLLYEVDTTAFGRESDIDGNGRVIVLMSNVINKLVTAQQCVSSGYVAGFFFPADLGTSMWNNGEVFYTFVADPTGSTGSCPHSIPGKSSSRDVHP